MSDEARCAVSPVCPKCSTPLPFQGTMAPIGSGPNVRRELVCFCGMCGWRGVTRASMPLVPERPAIRDAAVSAAKMREMLRDLKAVEDGLAEMAGEPTTYPPHGYIKYDPKDGIPKVGHLPPMFTYDEVLAAICPWCSLGVMTEFRPFNDTWGHLFKTLGGDVRVRPCLANDWRRSHPR